jgi:hypothetical protein
VAKNVRQHLRLRECALNPAGHDISPNTAGIWPWAPCGCPGPFPQAPEACTEGSSGELVRLLDLGECLRSSSRRTSSQRLLSSGAALPARIPLELLTGTGGAATIVSLPSTRAGGGSVSRGRTRRHSRSVGNLD